MGLQILLLVVAIAIVIPSGVLLVECLFALIARPKASAVVEDDCAIAILMPAHNEATVIAETLAVLIPQLSAQDELVVVADNCTDDTAQIAREMGATVLERTDEVHRGKGYALAHGIQFLKAAPPTAVVVVDADCQFRRGTVRDLAGEAIARQRPMQGIYLLERPAAPSLKEAVSIFAFKVKNLVRPLGLAQMKVPCLLTGTGMAFPWSVMASVDLVSGSIVEDMKLGFDCAISGMAPVLCPCVTVVGPLPPNDAAAKTQRTRWEHGHLQMIARYCPQLLEQAVRQQSWELGVIALDLLIPPLSLLVVLWLAATTLSTLMAAVLGLWLPALISYGAGLAIMLSVLLSWAGFAHADLSLKMLLSVPLYILWKIPVYLKFVTKPQVAWVRTGRKEEA